MVNIILLYYPYFFLCCLLNVLNIADYMNKKGCVIMKKFSCFLLFAIIFIEVSQVDVLNKVKELANKYNLLYSISNSTTYFDFSNK